MYSSNLLRNIFKYYCTVCCSPIICNFQHVPSEIIGYFRNFLYIFTRLLDTVNCVYIVLLIFGVFKSIHGKLGVFDVLEACLWLMAYLLYISTDVFLWDKEFFRNFDKFVVLTENILNADKTQTPFERKVNKKLKWKCWRFIIFSA